MTLLATFLVFLLAVGGLAIGTLAGRAPLRGSCGGGCGHCKAPCENAAHGDRARTAGRR